MRAAYACAYFVFASLILALFLGGQALSQTLRKSDAFTVEDEEHFGAWTVMFGEYGGGKAAAEAWVTLLEEHGALLEDVEANLIEIGIEDNKLKYFLIGGIFSKQQDAADICILMRIREVKCGLVQIDRPIISLARPMVNKSGTRISPKEALTGLGPYLPNFEEAMAQTGNEISRLDLLYGYWMPRDRQSHDRSGLPICSVRQLVLSPISVKILNSQGQASEMSCNFLSKSPEGQDQSHVHISCEDGSRATLRQITRNDLVLEQLFEPDEKSPRSIGTNWVRCQPQN